MELVAQCKYVLTAPVCDPAQQHIVYALCRRSGAVVSINTADGSTAVVTSSESQPTGLLLGAGAGPRFLLADPSRHGIVALDGEGSVSDFLTSFEGRPLLGPSSVCADGTGELIFTDSGLPGDSSLAAPIGSVYRTANGRRQLVRVIKPSLAFPSAVAAAHGGSVVYVAEMCRNRILRVVQLPEGYAHTSVFVRLSGTMGPSALAVHPGTLDIYVGMYDIGAVSSGGCVHVFDAAGELKGTIAVRGSQITGLAFSSDQKHLLITVDGGAQSFLYRSPVVGL